MDLGVGSFVFSQGLVSAIPFISQPHYLLQPTIYKTLRKALPILALGLLRVVLVKGTDYPVSTKGHSLKVCVLNKIRNM